MNVALRPSMSLEEFLAWESAQEERHEFDGCSPVPVNGGTYAHIRITMNLIFALRDALSGSAYAAIYGNIQLQVAGRIRYPDAIVSRSDVPLDVTILPNPVVVIEVVSDSTQRTDRRDKVLEYRATPSIQHYAIVEQDRVMATLFSRDGDDWAGRVLTGDDVLAFTAIGVTIPLSAAYAGLEIAP